MSERLPRQTPDPAPLIAIASRLIHVLGLPRRSRAQIGWARSCLRVPSHTARLLGGLPGSRHSAFGQPRLKVA